MRYVAALLLLHLYIVSASAETGTVTVGEYVASVVEGAEGADILEITRGGELVYSESRYLRIRLSRSIEDTSIPLSRGEDVSGDGVPDLIVTGWSGGAHCCFRTWVFSLGGTFELLAAVDGVHEEARIRQMDGDGALEFEVKDWTFNYWPTSFGSTPTARVALDWDSNALKPSLPLTETLQPDHGDLAAEAGRLRQGEGWASPYSWPLGAVFQRALELAYLGRSEEAAEFISACWGGDDASLASHSLEFGRRLERSEYFRQLEAERRARQRPSQR